MTKYEIMYIIRPTATEETRQALVEEFNNIFTSRDSQVNKVDEWGLRDMAYEIQKHRKGYYVIMEVTANEEARSEFDRVIRIREDVLRYIIIKDVR